jgi:hypothetical protein
MALFMNLRRANRRCWPMNGGLPRGGFISPDQGLDVSGRIRKGFGVTVRDNYFLARTFLFGPPGGVLTSNTSLRNLPVCDFGLAATSSGVPSAMTRPPSPPRLSP